MSNQNTTRYRLLVENSSDLVAEVTPEGRFLYVSPNFETLLGYAPEELIGGDVFAQIHPDDLELARQNFVLPEASATVRYRHKNGAWRWLDMNGRDFVTPSGEVRAVIIARDVTARRQAEEALRRSEQHTRAILDNALDAIVAMSADGLITEWNAQAERVFGWQRNEVMGRKMAEILIPESLRAQHEEGLRQFLNTGVSQILNRHCEMPALHRDGREIPVELSIAPIPAGEGVGFCSFIRDLSGLKEAEAGRARLLAVITGNNELASMEMDASHPAAECHAEIHRACQRAADLVRQILSFSRPQPSERRILDLSSVVAEAIRMLRPVLPASIEIRTSCDPTCASVLADSGQLMQVLLNLAAGVHPDLHPGNYVKLSIRDTGHGMDTATLEKIFEPFFTTKSAGDGTGLGLSVVHGIVKSHGGAIQVSSELNKGTSFHLYFPAAEGSAPLPKPPVTNLPLGNGERILLVEDEPALAESGRRILLRIGYQPTICHNAAEALSLLQNSPAPFAAIMCDLTMPGRSGMEFAEESRRYRAGIPFILTSGSSAALPPEELQARGITARLEKPFTPQTLAETLRHVLTESCKER
jgi:PAS domain S-box-containing protein